MQTDKKTGAERQATYRARMKEGGLIETTIWATAAQIRTIKKLLKKGEIK